MLAVDHAVRDNTGEKRLNRSKHRDRKRIWNRRLNQFHVKNRQMKRRKQEPFKYSIRDGKQETLKGIVYLSIQSCYA